MCSSKASMWSNAWLWKYLLPQLVLDVLLRVEFRRIGWQEVQPQILGQCKAFALVATCTVDHHDDVLIRVTTPNLGDEQLHALGIDVRQHQRDEPSVQWRDGAIGVGVLVGKHGLDHWAHGPARPAVTRIADATKAGLVL